MSEEVLINTMLIFERDGKKYHRIVGAPENQLKEIEKMGYMARLEGRQLGVNIKYMRDDGSSTAEGIAIDVLPIVGDTKNEIYSN